MAAVTPAVAQNGLKISELLYQPRSGGAEYVELYNDTDTPLDLSAYHVVRVLNDTLAKHYPLPSYLLPPHAYVALTKDLAAVVADYAVPSVGSLVECNLPTYPNTGGAVALTLADSTLVERFDYTPSMHSPMLHSAAGVALERRRFDVAVGEAGNWFSASSVCGYGTPGYANSQSAEWLVPETAFELSSDIVSPDGDGYQDVLEMSYRMERGDLMANIDIYDAAGVRVASLLDAALLGAYGTVVWDAHGVARGRYLLLVTVYDRGGTHQTVRRTVAVVR